ncbi:alcohol dehydrogenase-like 6 [Cryptomeria japonica]|uniref:alcohol dehydrogenase-like 6 n=1 Tax=Cryptomeria japonica TaxID=3369 RepID=UPI0027DA9979|nr:alcohol dehydrogenase-like 6 [Cryptomeria japonica]
MASKKLPQSITCKAAVAWGPGEPLKMEEVQVAPPQPLEVRIKVVSTSLCRSDITFSEAQGHIPLFPRIFGHEATGIIESVGEDVIDLHEGDHVLTVFTGECKECMHCKSDKSNMCETLRMERKGVMHSDQKTRFSINGKPIYHFCAVSSFSEYTVVHSGCIVKLSSDVPLGKICVLGCGVATGFGAAWKVANIETGSTVVIFGLGTVGLSVAQGAKLRGASRIIGVDINPEKHERGKAFGITEFINPNDYKQPIQQVLKEITAGGADYCFECVGNVDVIRIALESCCDGWGMAVVVGVPSGKMELSAHYGPLLSGRTLKGTLLGGWKPRSELPILVDMYMKKEIQVDEYVTHELPFSEINKAYDLMREGKCLRCVMHVLN